MTYNGYANYETWAWSLWQDNDESSYDATRQMARDALADATEENDSEVLTDRESAIYQLSETLKSQAQEAAPELPASVWSDFISASLSEVDWHEIATNLIEEVEGEDG